MAAPFEDRRASGSLTAAWDGATPATAPAGTVVTVSLPAMGVVAAQLSGTFVGTISWEITANEVDWKAVPATNISTAAAAATATTAALYVISCPGARALRARCSAFTSGTILVFLNASSAAGGGAVTGAVTGNIQGTQALGVAVAQNPVLAGLIGSGTLVRGWTVANSENNTAGLNTPAVGPLVWDGTNWLRFLGANAADGSAGAGIAAAGNVGWDGTLWRRMLVSTTGRQDVFQRNSFANLAANATTTIKSGAGTLHSITINTKGAAANVATVYDNTAGSGTKIATLDTTAGPAVFVYDVAFATGLTVVLGTGTAADLTVAYA